MKLHEFKIGERFFIGETEYLCTDIGTRTVACICIEPRFVLDPTWLNGPPYAVVEDVMDEINMQACTNKPGV